jgi:hypothetical protein
VSGSVTENSLAIKCHTTRGHKSVKNAECTQVGGYLRCAVPVHSKKTDVVRATRAVLATGLEVARVEINSKDGKITVVPGKPDAGAPANPWDEVLTDAENEKRIA